MVSLAPLRISFAPAAPLTRALVVVLSLVFVGLAPAPGHAQDDRAQARAAFGRGVSQFESGAFQEALRSFQEAYRIAPHPSVRVNMANCYEQLDLPVEAVEHFERFLIEAENLPPAQRAEVQSALRRLRARIGEVFFRVEPDGAVVTIDGAQGLRAPILDAVPLREGTHELVVSAPSYRERRQTIHVRGGQRLQVAVELDEMAVAYARTQRQPEPPPREEPAQLTQPESETGTEDASGTDETTSASTWPMSTEEEEPASHPRRDLTAPLAMTGVTLGLALGAGIAGGIALGADSDFEDAVARSNDSSLSAAERAQARQDGLDADARAHDAAIASDVLLGLSVVSAGVTIYLYVRAFSRRDEEETTRQARTTLTPTFGREHLGLGLTQTF